MIFFGLQRLFRGVLWSGAATSFLLATLFGRSPKALPALLLLWLAVAVVRWVIHWQLRPEVYLFLANLGWHGKRLYLALAIHELLPLFLFLTFMGSFID
jgi:hypothetical protein